MECALPGCGGVMEPGPGVYTLWESCSGRKDNPRDVGLAEGQREGKRQTGGGLAGPARRNCFWDG